MYIPIWLIALTIAVLFLINRNKEKQKEFLPVRIGIEPKWGDLFKDYNVASDNSWEGRIPQNKEYDVIKKGITFTELNDELVYDDDYHCFQTKVDFRRDIDIVGATESERVWARFHVRRGIEGYELSIVTLESFKKPHILGDGTELIKIATIPYSELLFPWYSMQTKKKQAEIDQNIKKFGWTRTAPDAELSLICPEVILEHKYFFADYTYI